MWFLTNNIDSHSIEWAVYNVYKQGSETAQYGLEIILKRRGAYLIFRATSAALIQGWRLFKNCTRQIYYFYIFIQRYTQFLSVNFPMDWY